MILEKAYAKIHGSYKILSGGMMSEVLRAFTAAPLGGQMHRRFTVEENFKALLNCFKNNWAVTSAAGGGSKLVKGHAYSVLNAYNITLKSGEII